MRDSFSEALISVNFADTVNELFSLYREKGAFSEEALKRHPRLDSLRHLRGLSLQELNDWCAFQRHAEECWQEGEGLSLPWAIGDVPRDMVFGPTAPMVAVLLRNHGPSPLWRVADFGTGTAQRILDVAKAFPEATFRAFEPASDMHALALQNVCERGPRNLLLERRTAPQVAREFPDHFDVATSILCAHFAPSLEGHYQAIARSLRRGGILVMREFMISDGFTPRLWRFVCEFWCRAIAMRHAPLGEGDYLRLLEGCGFRLEKVYENDELLALAGQKPEDAFNRSLHAEQSDFARALRFEMGISDQESRPVLRSRRILVLRKE